MTVAEQRDPNVGASAAARIAFQTHPERYRHWRLVVDGPVAQLLMDVDETAPLRSGYALKLNSYDLGVDIELADAVQRLRFEHPEVRAVVVTSGQAGCFCAGANIYMLSSSSHAFKVNFCKFTNETRLYMEEASAQSGQHYIAALNGLCAGGGYELALACEQIVLQDDRSSAVSLPETALLGVLPGTGGLTRLVDKRRVRRDLADVFSSIAEGVRGERARQWGLVDAVAPRSTFEQAVAERAQAQVERSAPRQGAGISLGPVEASVSQRGPRTTLRYRHLELEVDEERRVAELTMHGPEHQAPTSARALREQGSDGWSLRAYRELDDALLQLRFNYPTAGLVLLRTEGQIERVREHDAALMALSERDWLAREIRLHMARVLRRLDLTARSLFAVIEPGSCFAASLLELALAADRSYMLDGQDEQGREGALELGAVNFGPLPMSNGLTRLQTRFLGDEAALELLAAVEQPLGAEAALRHGLATFAPDDMDWEDDLRVAVEERASLSPDALTGMEANLRFAGPETMETKIFGRLTAWQNWIFQRPNAVGERGALTNYGAPTQPRFDWHRT